MKKTKKALNKNALYIYGIYNDIISNEKHYTVLQAKYRTLTAYWLLVIFAAIGIIFSTQEIGIPVDHLIATILMCIIGTIGNSFIWYEDMINLEKLLNLNHLEGMRLEKKYTWLPRVHHQHLMVTNKHMLKLKNIFYVGSNLILFFITISAYIFYFLHKNVIYTIIGSVMISLIFIYYTRYMFIKAYKNELSVLEDLVK